MKALVRNPVSSIAVAAVCAVVAATAAPAVMAQNGAETVVIPGGSSVRSSVTPKNPSKIIANTATESQVATSTLTDHVVRRLNQPQDDLTFTVTNDTNNPINYEFNSGKQFEVAVTDSSGKTVWSLSDHKVYSPLITHMTLKPGKSVSYDSVWNRRDTKDRPVPAGVYTAVAELVPLARIVVSGTSTMDVDREGRDPTNVGTPSTPTQMSGSDDSQAGSVEQSNITPTVQAKTQIVVSR